ncbi:MAG: hypothetical protein LBP59_13285 [Planctomycetaceae bacterium]|jgi:hypothetical protein|nr:hypothetical protein [Planctomycetaceae bacterium]
MQMNRVILFFVVVICCYVLLSQVAVYSASEVDSELVNEFTQDAPVKWKKYLTLLQNFEGDFEEKLTRTDYAIKKNQQLEIVEVIQRQFVVDFPNIICRVIENDKVVQIDGSNRKYFFRLNSDDGKNWKIINVEKHVSIPTLDDLYFPDKRNDNWKIFSAYKTADYSARGLLLIREWLPVLIQMNDFKIIEIENIVENNIRLVRIAYEFEPKETDTKTNLLIGIRSGEIFLLPNSYWLVKKGKCYFASPNDVNGRYSITWENEYTANKNNTPILVKRSAFCNLADKNETKTWTRTTTFTLNEIIDKNQKRFTLSNYGFPEPDFIDLPTTNWVNYIFMVLGFIMIFIAILSITKKLHNKK